jgi:hypothetical protein
VALTDIAFARRIKAISWSVLMTRARSMAGLSLVVSKCRVPLTQSSRGTWSGCRA